MKINTKDHYSCTKYFACKESPYSLILCSVAVQIGPRDYWSQRMAELTGGKQHRVLFDETLEKIYNRLYTEASMTP